MYPLSLMSKPSFVVAPRCGTGAGSPAQGLGLHIQEAAGTSVRGDGPEARNVPGRPTAGPQRGAGRGAAQRLPAEGGKTMKPCSLLVLN